MRTLAIVIVAVLVSGSAAADPVPPPGFALPDLAIRDRVGASVSVGYAEASPPGAPDLESYTLFSIEPFVRFAVAPSLAVYASVPVTWTDGETVSQGGELANLTGGVLYAPGRFAAGASLSMALGHAPEAHAVLNRFDLDHYIEGVGLRLHANVEHRAGKLRLAGEFAVLVLADEQDAGALVRVAGGAGIDLPRGVTAIAEFLVLTDALEDRFGGEDDFFQALNLGVRGTVHDKLIGFHVYLPLDRVGDEDIVGVRFDLSGDF